MVTHSWLASARRRPKGIDHLQQAPAHGLPGYEVHRGPAEQRLAADLAAAVARIGAAAGRPWRKEQKLATVAALVAATGKES